MRAGRTAFDLHFRKEALVPMRIVFMGTPEFAVPSLTALFEAGYEIVAVFTQPDKPVGRKQILTPPAVKVEAQRLGLPVYQPEIGRAHV